MKPVFSERLSTEDIIAYYNPEVEKIAKYLPWLESQLGGAAFSNFKEQGIEGSSVTFPVYDSNCLAFVRTCNSTGLMNRNYVYTYSRNRLKDASDERAYIARASIKEMGELWDILSKYILGGNTKATLWGEGVSNGVYVSVIKKMQELIAFWSKEGRKN